MANNTNTILRENPRLQTMPTDQRNWSHFINELQKWVVDLDVNGRLTSERSFPQVLLSNLGSVQDEIPLTATDAGASASIAVAAHTLSRQVGDVSYNAGSITGLAYDTVYYVYVDDPTYAGGAVTYLSTTTRADIVDNLGRYFVGQVTTPAAAADSTIGGPGAGAGNLVYEVTRGMRRGGEAEPGLVEIATQTEVNTGTDTSNVITPATLANSTLSSTVALVVSVLNAVVSSSPNYTPSNDTTDRTWDANQAAGAISATPTQAEVENIRDAVLEISDVLATLVTDLQDKNVLGP